MRITIVYRYFWPDTAPYSLLLAKMVPWLTEAGHEVNIIAGQPAYGQRQGNSPSKEHVFGANVRRVSLLPKFLRLPQAINMLCFSIIAALSILFGKRQDVVWFGTTPPVVQAFLVNIAARIRGAKTIYQMQDIHPEVAIHSGMMKSSFVTRVLEALDRYTLKHATVVTVLSQDMMACIQEKTGGVAKLRIINNFAIETISDLKSERKPPIRFCYAGNIGQFQNLGKLVKQFAFLKEDEAVLDVLGDGKIRKQLESWCVEKGVKTVKFFGRKTPQETLDHLMNCHIGVISLVPGIYKYAFPTKTHTYRAAGLKLFAMIEEDSELACKIRDEKLGVSVPWSADENTIMEALRAIINDCLKTNGHSDDGMDWHPDYAQKQWMALLNEMQDAHGLGISQ